MDNRKGVYSLGPVHSVMGVIAIILFLYIMTVAEEYDENLGETAITLVLFLGVAWGVLSDFILWVLRLCGVMPGEDG